MKDEIEHEDHRHKGEDQGLFSLLRYSISNILSVLPISMPLGGQFNQGIDFEEEIQQLTEAVRRTRIPPEHPLHSHYLSQLAKAFGQQFARTGSRGDLEKSIKLHREALKHPHCPCTLRDLADTLDRRFQLTNAPEDLNESIQLRQKLLDFHPVGHSKRGYALANLANATHERSHHADVEHDHEASIPLFTEALKLLPPNYEGRRRSSIGLSCALLARYRRTGSEEDCEKILRLCKEDLNSNPPGTPDRSVSLNNLVVALHTRYEHTNAREHLEPMLPLLLEALDLCPANDAEQSYRRDHLRGTLSGLSDYTSPFTGVMTLLPLDCQNRSICLRRFSWVLLRIYEHTGSGGDSENAVRFRREGTSLHPTGNQERGKSLLLPADAFCERDLREGTLTDYKTIIPLYRELLTLLPLNDLNDPYRIFSLHQRLSYALLCSCRDKRPRGKEDMEEASRLLQNALPSYPRVHRDWLRWASSFARSRADTFYWEYLLDNTLANKESIIPLFVEAMILALLIYSDGGVLPQLFCALLDCWKHTSEEEDLEEAILLLRENQPLQRIDGQERNVSFFALSNAFRRHYRLKATLIDFTSTIPLFTQVLTHLPLDDRNRSIGLRCLSSVLLACYEYTKQEEDVREAVRLLQEDLSLHPTSDPEHAISSFALVDAYHKHYLHTGSLSGYESAIPLFAEVLTLLPRHDHNRSINLRCLSSALLAHYEQTSEAADVEKAIRLLQEDLSLYPTGGPERGVSLFSLADAFHRRYLHTGTLADCESAISRFILASKLLPREDRNHSSCLRCLSSALLARYEHTGKEEDMEEAIRLLRRDLSLHPTGHPERCKSLHLLSDALHRRYHDKGTSADNESAIHLLTEALMLLPPNDLARAYYLSALYSMLVHRNGLAGTEIDLAEIGLPGEEYLALRSSKCLGRGRSSCNTTFPSFEQYDSALRQGSFKTVVQLAREALELHPPEDLRRIPDLLNLTNILVLETERMHTPSNSEKLVVQKTRDFLDERIGLLTDARKFQCPQNHYLHFNSVYSLSCALYDRYLLIDSQDDLKESIHLLEELRAHYEPGHPRYALTAYRFAARLQRCSDFDTRSGEALAALQQAITHMIASPVLALECVLLWVKIARQVAYSLLGEAYDWSIRFLRRYFSQGPTVKLQYDALACYPELLQLPMDAAAHAIQSENPDVERAVEILDEGRSLLLTQARNFREQLIESPNIDTQLAERFESARRELQQMSTAEARVDSTPGTVLSGTRQEVEGARGLSGVLYDGLLRRKRILLEEYNSSLICIRSKPGFEDFLRRPSFAKLREAAKGGAAVIVNCSKYGSHIIIVYADKGKEPSVIKLDDGDENFRENAELQLELYLREQRTMQASESEAASEVFGKTLKIVTKWLWRNVVSKVVAELERVGVPRGSRVWWCPTSFLTFLPFHAANNGSKLFFMDSYISSYTPTLKALVDARSTPPEANRHGSKPQLPSLLVVAQSSDLATAGTELEYVRDTCTSTFNTVRTLDGAGATRQSVRERLPNYDWIHFVCHGDLSNDPFDSSLRLNRGSLSLNDIIRLSLPNAQFAFLAACHTAEQSSRRLSDEVLHLAGALQCSGFRSVIGTMWAMKDEDGPDVARRFYEEVLKENDDGGTRHTRAAHALQVVTKEMRKGKRLPMERWVNFVHIGA